jgi:uncharacterized membrane protein (DUF485 family)
MNDPSCEAADYRPGVRGVSFKPVSRQPALVSRQRRVSAPAHSRLADNTRRQGMQDDFAARVAAHPDYIALKRARTRFGWTLTGLMLIVYYGFILLVAFNKPFLAQRLGDGVMTVGIPIGLGVILFTVVITVIYVRRANSEYDTLAERITKGVLK